MKLDENDPGSVAARPVARADGALVRWFENHDAVGGVAGTQVDQDAFNDLLGILRDLFTQAGITKLKGAANDGQFVEALDVLSLAQAVGYAAPLQGYTIGMALKSSGGSLVQLSSGGGGKFSDDSGTVVAAFAGAFGKLVGGTWVEGTGLGGEAAASLGTVDTDGWWAVHALTDATGSIADMGLDSSKSAANLLVDPAVILAGYTHYKLLGWAQNVGTLGSPVVREFKALRGQPEFVEYIDPVLVYRAAPTWWATPAVHDMVVPCPTGKRAYLGVSWESSGATQSQFITIDSNTSTPRVPSATVYDMAAKSNAAGDQVFASLRAQVRVDNASQVSLGGFSNAGILTVWCFGYEYPVGRE